MDAGSEFAGAAGAAAEAAEAPQSAQSADLILDLRDPRQVGGHCTPPKQNTQSLPSERGNSPAL